MPMPRKYFTDDERIAARRLAQARYRLAHHAKLLARMKKYRQRNREYFKAKKLEDYHGHKEKYKEKFNRQYCARRYGNFADSAVLLIKLENTIGKKHD